MTSPTGADRGFSGKQAAEIVGITYRQLDYWARTELVQPTLAPARGSGTRRRYSYQDLLELKVVKSLLDAGIDLQKVREVFSYLRDRLGEDVVTANLVIQGTRSVLVKTQGELVDILQQGQGVLNILPLAGVKEDVDAAIIEMPGTDEAAASTASRPAPATAEAPAPRTATS